MLVPTAAWAGGPPALPEGEAAPAEAAPAEAAPAEAAPAEAAPTEAAPAEAAPVDTGSTATDTGASTSASGDISAELSDAGLSGEADGEAEGEGRRGRRRRGEDDADAADDGDPGMVRGRREHLMNTNRGAAGLFTTTLPDVGGKYTFRFKLHTDFFRREAFIYEGNNGPDQHARVRGGVAMSFSPFEWGELFMSVNSQANRNARDQPGRQDAEAIFALGDVDFGIKGAYRFKKGIGVGGQVGVGLLSGSERLLTSGVNVWFDGLFAVDIRYLTSKQFPFRFTANLGWIFDSSLNLAPYGRISDDVSREVTRFALGSNHNRLRMRYAVDFPIRLGKERQFGIDPILEWSWDVSTQEESLAFGRDDAVDSPLPRSSQWLTLGVRANVISGLHLEAAADIGMVSPNFEFGPPTPPWQVILGLGWSFDPNPVVKEVEVAAEAPPPPPPEPKTVLEGRIVGQVVDPSGVPIPDARIMFPGLTTTAVVTDANGGFTSFRFPAGQIAMQVMLGGDVVQETTADVVDGEDTSLTIQLDAPPAPATGIVEGTVTDDQGGPVQFSMRVNGQGVDQAFDSTPGGRIALELYVGDYSGTITAPGFKPKTITITVPEGGSVQVSETLEKDAPPETPNVIGSKSRIRLKKKIQYKGNKVSTSSHGILDELAIFLNAHPEYQQVQVGVHTDDRGAAQRRSEERAKSVKNYLVSKGVSPSRLSTRGYGASKPVAVNLTAAGRAKNNRTALSVKKYGG